jgi:hypothetical protein
MNSKTFWKTAGLAAVILLAVVGTVLKTIPGPAPAPSPLPIPSPNPDPVPAPPNPGVPYPGIAAQNARLLLTDGRAATFRFASSGGSLSCAAAVGLDQVVAYELLPIGNPSPPNPLPPNPVPTPPAPTPAPTPAPATSNLRVLFLYDPVALIDLPPGRQALLASPELRSYLDGHCPKESGCTSGRCPLAAGTPSPSYRFLPNNADVSRLPPVWQQTCKAAAGRAMPWMIAVNEAGQTVIDQAWPESVAETLALLKKYGGP